MIGEANIPAVDRDHARGHLIGVAVAEALEEVIFDGLSGAMELLPYEGAYTYLTLLAERDEMLPLGARGSMRQAMPNGFNLGASPDSPFQPPPLPQVVALLDGRCTFTQLRRMIGNSSFDSFMSSSTP